MSLEHKLSTKEEPAGLYEKLDTSSIRLLEILPSADARGMITCRLVTVALSSDPIYVALSYTWGSPLDTAEIIINGHNFLAQGNLVSALRQIRNRSLQSSDFGSKLFWADAICINQNEGPEKTQQVQIMGMIYGKASMVLSWLGPDKNKHFLSAIKAIRLFGDEAKLSSAWLKDLSWMKRYPWLIETNSRNDEGPNETWRSLKRFLSDPYWGRVWILQEMVLASNLQVMTGSDLVPYRNIECTIEMIESFGQRSAACPAFIPYELWHFLTVPGRFDVSNFLQVEDFRQFIRHMDRMGDAEKLERIMSTWPRQSTYPLDKVYAVQGLLQNVISPDYDKTSSEVYCDLASKWVALTGDLDILRFSGKAFESPPIAGPILASWVPNWHAISKIDNWEPFPASVASNNSEWSCLRSADVTSAGHLRVKGSICDTVTTIEPHFDLKSFSLPEFYAAYSDGDTNTQYPTGIPKLQAVLRTILMENFSADETEFNPESHSVQCSLLTVLQILGLHRATKDQDIIQVIHLQIEELGITSKHPLPSFFAKALPGVPMNENFLIERNVALEVIRQVPIVWQCLLKCFADERRLFHTSSGYLGIGPCGMLVGDIVCMLQGCAYPVLLRADGSYHILVGTVFVIGLMKGEVDLDIKRGFKSITEFVIR